jgi:carboxymethylenebutenolidase
MALKDYIVQEVAIDCEAGLLSRREALRRLGLLGVTAAAATALLAACGDGGDDGSSSSPAASSAGATPSSGAPAGESSSTPTSSSGDAPATAEGEEIRFSGPSGELIGVVAETDTPRGAVLVIHENRGLTPHIRSIPPRLAADGYTALAVDLLSEEGGTASLPTEGDATGALGNAPIERMIADLRAGLDELGRRAPDAKLATIGFCFGGGMTWQLLAAGEPRLAAAVPFYGPFPTGANLAGSPNAAVLGIYAGLDDRVNGTKDAAEAALAAAALTHELRVFDGVDHAFFNDTGSRYDAGAAAQAYQAMLDWFGQHLAS